MSTVAAVLYAPGERLRVESLGLGDLPDHCLLVRVAASGVCGTDVHVVQGVMESKFGFPVVLGHEAAGTVEAVGSGAKGFEVGDRVVVTASLPCGACALCREEKPYLCERSWEVAVTHPFRTLGNEPVHAFFGIGSLSQFVIVPATAAIKLPDDIPWSVAALIACGGQTGLGSAFNIADLSEESSVVVFGCGPVGLCVVVASKVLKARNIIAVDVNRMRRQLAREIGASNVLDPTEERVLEAVLDLTGGGAETVFECVGKVEVIEEAFTAVRPGGTLVVVGAPQKGAKFSIEARELLIDRKVVGSFAGSSRPELDYPKWFSLYREGRLPLDRLVSSSYTLHSVNEAFHDMAQGRVVKPIIILEAPPSLPAS